MVDDNKAAGQISVWFVLSRTFSILFMLLPIYAGIQFPQLMQNSDYLTAFYVAGRSVLENGPDNLYPAALDSQFFTTAFNNFAHRILPHMPAQSTAIYMYPPLVALLFVPLSALNPQWSLAVWQGLSIFAVWLSVWLLCTITDKGQLRYFWFVFLFMPVFQTLLIGQLGLVFGLLPLMAGFARLMKGHDVAAGVLWSILLLKPQFLPVALLISGALGLSGRWRCAVGLVCGSALIIVLMVVCLGPGAFTQWLASFRLSDTIFSNPAYHYPTYLVSSMPGIIVQAISPGHAGPIKLVAYGLAAAIGLQALWISTSLLKKHEPSRVLPFLFVLGLFVLPLVLPHFLYYDLCCLAATGMVAFGFQWESKQSFVLRMTCLIAWVALNLYDFVFVLSPLARHAQPAIIVVVLGLLYVRLLVLARQQPLVKAAGLN